MGLAELENCDVCLGVVAVVGLDDRSGSGLVCCIEAEGLGSSLGAGDGNTLDDEPAVLQAKY